MTFTQKKLYHQIHPAKVAIDSVSAIVSLFFFWYHSFFIAITIHLLFPVLGSFFIISYFDLRKQQQSQLGRYIKRSMTVGVEIVRLLGDIITVFGAWVHSFPLIIIGLLVIIGAWCSGMVKK